MSIWISDTLRGVSIAVLVLGAGLSACTSSRLGGNTPPAARSASTTTSINVSGRSIIIEGPPGFCVDNQVSQIEDDAAFVILGNCAIVSQNTWARGPKVRALLTAAASSSGDAVDVSIGQSVNSMDRFFHSEIGRTALSRTSDPATVIVLETFHQDETFYLRARDDSPGLVPGASADYWRAYFDLDGQIVAASVIGFDAEPLSPDTSLDTLQDFTFRIKQRNGVKTQPAVRQVAAVVEEEETTSQDPYRTSNPDDEDIRKRKKGNFWQVGILRRFLN